MTRGSLLVLVALTIAPVGAAAEEPPGPWYYNWECSGPCRPSVDHGREGPLATYEECDRARWDDPRMRDHMLYLCERPTSMGPIGWGGTLPAADAAALRGGSPVVSSTAVGPPNKVQISSIEMGLAAGTGWSATGEDGVASAGPVTLGLEVETHTGKRFGGGTLMMGLQSTWLTSPLLGEDARRFMVLPLFVGIALTPEVYSRGSWSIRPDVGASLGGFLAFGCADCPGAVFGETTRFGYSLKAGVDVHTSKDRGFSLEAVFPRWALGSATPGNPQLDSPEVLVRLSIIGRPANP